VKPDNILFVDGRLLLADISFVAVSSAGLVHAGTEGYIPPAG
jgi:hypothetical protein